MKPAALWPLAVVGALVVTVVANIALLVMASDTKHLAVEPDYYRKAVAWDSTRALQDESASLGWRLGASLAPVGDGALVRLTIADRTGAPLTGARVHLEGIHNLDPNRRVEALLPEAGRGSAPGLYEAALPLRHRGLWELRFDIVRGADRYAASLRRELAAGP